MLEATTANELMSQEHSPKVRIFTCAFVRDELLENKTDITHSYVASYSAAKPNS